MRASFTYSESSTSSMDERTKRINAATWNQPIAMAGRMKLLKPLRPEVGTSSSSTAKIHINTIPNQKAGNDWPNSAIDLPAKSKTLSFFTAERTPIGAASTVATTTATPASMAAAGSRSSTRLMAVRQFHFHDSPRLPVKAFFMKTRYCW